jgi:anthranilate/para-aminobenzoate synthase component II
MILVINNETKHLKVLFYLLKRHKIPYKLRNFRSIELKDTKEFDAIILTGGHWDPLESRLSREIGIIKKSGKPILGICLGFQLVCRAYYSTLKRIRKEHGIKEIRIIKKDRIFRKCPALLNVSEHHEWSVKKAGKELEVLAVSADGIEAVRHRKKQIYGVQFHPEIIKNNQGHRVVENFLKTIKQN